MSDLTPETGPRMLVEYTNYRGETARRIIVPVRFWWGKTEWHQEDQWLLHAWDAEKEAYRDFSFQDMRPIPNDATSSAIAAQAAEITNLQTDVRTYQDIVKDLTAENEAHAAELTRLRAQVATDADILLDAYKALLVLHRVCDKAGLFAGAEAANSIADRIVAAHPETPGRTALRAALSAYEEARK
jgi:hypothetical protein